jgi:pyridoxal/pyridoxine/pyridoxamine kinase
LPWDELQTELNTLEQLLNAADAPAIYQQLQKLVTGFVPDSEVVDLIAKG